jgi:Na+-transporting methylmalonyl-CoA/oxaloacetate decarboxylase gamma subunit
MGEKVKVVLAWVVVLITAVWGVGQVVSKSAVLFK